MEVCSRIRQLRELKGYTVNRLANQAGVSQSYLRDLELGNKNPTIETLSAICWALDISLKDFFDTESTTSFFKDPLLRAIYRLEPYQRAALTSFLQSMENEN